MTKGGERMQKVISVWLKGIVRAQANTPSYPCMGSWGLFPRLPGIAHVQSPALSWAEVGKSPSSMERSPCRLPAVRDTGGLKGALLPLLWRPLLSLEFSAKPLSEGGHIISSISECSGLLGSFRVHWKSTGFFQTPLTMLVGACRAGHSPHMATKNLLRTNHRDPKSKSGSKFRSPSEK